MKQGIVFIIGIAIIAAALVYMTTTYASLKKRELNDRARSDCAQASRYTVTTDNGVVVWYPVPDLYKKCLEEKNII